MIAILRTLAIRLALCLLLEWVVWRAFGTPSLPLAVPMFGVALARPLIDLGSAIRHELRRAHWRDAQGRHFVFRGHTLHVVEDADHQRWVRLADVRAIVGFTATALQMTYANGWMLCGHPPAPHLSDEALLAHLAKERAPTAAKLRHWVEREIVFPARRQRQRHGIRIESPDVRASD
jgi:hypothetical protein